MIINKLRFKKAVMFGAIVLFFLLFVGTTVAYITSRINENKEYVIGTVKVRLKTYFEKDGNIYDPVYYTADLGNSDFTKTGVVKINISARDDIYFAENFRVDVEVYSDVDTYFRVATYEQLTLLYKTGDVTRELAVVQDGYTDFNYNFKSSSSGLFYDNREKDGFIYCMEKVKRVNESSPLVIPLIKEYYSDKMFGTRDSRYFLQIGFIIEAVQYYDGAQNNWDLEKTPWDTDW